MYKINKKNYSTIIDWIEPESRVLDLGCGDGSLLECLRDRKQVNGVGVEISEDKIIECLKKDLCVYQSDIDQGLSLLGESSFDYVILNATLQAVHFPYRVMNEMLRVGRSAIISVSNFGYIRNRLQVMLTGRVSDHIRLYSKWHDSPAIRFVSISEFSGSLKDIDMEAVGARYFSPFGLIPGRVFWKNLLAREALFKVRRIIR